MNNPTLDLFALLCELEDRLATVGDPIVHNLRDGLSEDQVVERFASHNLAPPVELVTWWCWHDGAAATGGITSRRLVRGYILSLAEAFETRVTWRDSVATDALQVAQDSGLDRSIDWYWKDTWLPFLGMAHNGIIVADCAHDVLSPIHNISYEDADGLFQTPESPSVLSVTAAWVKAIDGDALSWDRSRQLWLEGPNWTEWPPEERRLLF